MSSRRPSNHPSSRTGAPTAPNPSRPTQGTSSRRPTSRRLVQSSSSSDESTHHVSPPANAPQREGRAKAVHESSVLELVTPRLTDAKIIRPAIVDVAFFDKVFLPIREILDAAGWTNFCTFRANYNSPLVRVFYSNLETTNQFILRSSVGSRAIEITPENLAQRFNLPLHPPSTTVVCKFLSWPFDRLDVLNSFLRSKSNLTVYPTGITDTDFKLVPHLLHKVLHKVILPRGGSKNYVTLLDMFILGHLFLMLPLSLPHILIGYMTSTCSAGRHLPYAHIITSYLESAQVDLALGGRPLSVFDSIDMATLKAMKYRYIRERKQWTRDDVIPYNQHHSGYESTDDPFDAPDYLEYSYHLGDDDQADDEGEASHNDDDGDQGRAQASTVPEQTHEESTAYTTFYLRLNTSS
ncbi:hypothetical protein Syun_014705 [Stephania yunnanensis]|uniref:Putative plant transposon protein domain-containing protein n=1 Tax=Stephania yunnanensis TaxID=152371 RepID=A0AAP0JM03_9MAGN